jgi:hypothetical protein
VNHEFAKTQFAEFADLVFFSSVFKTPRRKKEMGKRTSAEAQDNDASSKGGAKASPPSLAQPR